MKLRVSIVLACAALCASASSAGPISPYYLTDNAASRIVVVQGNSVVNSAPMNYGTNVELPIAVNTDVRTMGYTAGGSGGQYTLGLTPTGTIYANPNSGESSYDGTTDGVHNFAVDFTGHGVKSYGLDWSSPTNVFTAGASNNPLGITYDPTNNSLWISDYFGGTNVVDYAMNGTVLSSFSTGHIYNMALALDHADNTLWLNLIGTGTFEQYSKSGILLSTMTIASLNGHFIYGGEFAVGSVVATPEPTTLAGAALACMAGLAALRRNRRNQAA